MARIEVVRNSKRKWCSGGCRYTVFSQSVSRWRKPLTGLWHGPNGATFVQNADRFQFISNDERKPDQTEYQASTPVRICSLKWRVPCAHFRNYRRRFLLCVPRMDCGRWYKQRNRSWNPLQLLIKPREYWLKSLEMIFSAFRSFDNSPMPE